MRSLIASTVLVAVAALSAATTSSALKTADSFSSSTTGSNNGFVAPLHVAPIRIGDAGSVISKHELESVIEITIGTPPQKLYAAFDTGSFIPVMYNTSCTMPDCGNATKYDSSKSSTAVVDFSFKVNEDYGAGNTSGYTAIDVFSFPAATMAGQNITFNENFTVINYVHWHRSQNGLAKLPRSDGIFGMGPYGSLPFNTNTTSRILVEKFGIDLVAVRMPRGLPFDSGVVQFGGYDKVNPEQKMPVWTPSVSPYFFMIEIQDVLFNGKSTGVCYSTSNPNSQCQALLDTGGGIIEFVGTGLNNHSLPNLIDCNKVDQLPTFGVVVANKTFTLHPQDYILQVPGTNGLICETTLVVVTPSSGNGNNNNEGMLTMDHIKKKAYTTTPILSEEDFLAAIKHGQGGAFMDFGIQWTARVTTIFDWKNHRVGLIEHN